MQAFAVVSYLAVNQLGGFHAVAIVFDAAAGIAMLFPRKPGEPRLQAA